MALNTGLFVVFTCVCCLGAYLLPVRLRWLLLLAASVGLYLWATSGKALQTPSVFQKLGLPPIIPSWVLPLALMLALTLISWLCGLLIQASKSPIVRTGLLILGLGACLALWAATKYTGLLSHFRLHVGGIVTGQSLTSADAVIALPLGLSFGMVRACAYLADVYCQRATSEKNPLMYLLFIAFFPAVFLGPIGRASELIPQLRSPSPFHYQRVSGGLFRILWGFFKVLVIGANLSRFTAYVFSVPALNTGPILAAAIILFAMQLFADFSGCCDIALGAALMLGISLPENFNQPFAAASLAGLLKRWHLSFTSVLEENIYRPLSQWHPQLKSPAVAKFLRPLPAAAGYALCAILVALWHGLSWDWLLWAAACIVLVAIGSLTSPYRQKLAAGLPRSLAPVWFWAGRLGLFLSFCATLPFFLSGLFNHPTFQWLPSLLEGWNTLFTSYYFNDFKESGLSGWPALAAFAGLLMVLLCEWLAAKKSHTIAGWIRTKGFYLRWPLYYLLLAAIYFFGVYDGSPGIYQRF